MSDDELRRRLREIPAPTTRLDVDAAIAGARRTRRPKVAAVTAATAGAGVLIIAPFLAPGLQGFQPTSAPGVAEDAGAPAQESGPEAGTSGGDSDGGEETLSGPGSTIAGCLLDDAEVATGVVIEFADDPTDGVATVRFAFPPEGGAFSIDGIGVAQVAPDGRVVTAPDPRSAEVQRVLGTGRGGAVEGGVAGPAAAIDVTMVDVALLEAPSLMCGVESGTTAPAPVLWLTDAKGRAITVVGQPWNVR